MADGRKYNGGARKGAGRPSKAEELKVSAYATDAIEKEYGSIQEFWQFLASQSRESKDHLKMIVEYAFGKPQDKVDLTSDGDKVTGINFVVRDGSED